MIPRLFENTETTFDTFGICPLIDAISCFVTEERNGEYVLDLEYPRDGCWADELSVDRIILAQPNDTATEPEPFRISEIDFDILGNITVHAQHISYQLNHIIIGRNTNYTRYPATFWNKEDDAKISASNPFTFSTDISDDAGTVYEFGCDKPTPLRTLLGGSEGSMLDLYGGEFEWNRYTVKLWANRGADNGVKIAYTKNLTGLDYNIDLSNIYTGVIAYFDNGTNYNCSDIETTANSYGFNRIKIVDATNLERWNGSTPSTQALNEYAAELAAAAPGPSVSVDVEFVPLWQTEEYKDFYVLEHVALCDTVTVIYPPLDLSIQAKVVKTEYNVLADRYESITISSIRPALADTIFTMMKEIEK